MYNNKGEDKDEDNKKYEDEDDNKEKKKISIIKTTEQNLITEDNKVSISQMKTMEDFLIKPKKKRSIKNNSLANKLASNKKHSRNIHNYSNIANNNNNNNYIGERQNDKKKLTLTTNEINNPKRIRDIILNNRITKKDSLDSKKKLIQEDSEEEEKNPIQNRPNSSNKVNIKKLKKEKSKESYFSHKNKINKYCNEFKTSEHSIERESPDDKTKKAIKIMINNEKIKKNILNSLIDYLTLEEVKNKDFRSFLRLYWNILSLRHNIINFFSFIKIFHITISYTPYQIKIVKFLFMLMINMFINALILTQDYFKEKFYYFNNKYNILDIELENGISKSEKLKYAMNNSFPRVMISFIICLIIQGLFEYIFFCERKKMYKLFALKGFNEINKNIRVIMAKIRLKYYIYILINFSLAITFYIYLTNFCSIYIGGIFDYIGAGIWTFIMLELFPFLSSLILSILRYYGIKKSNNTIYKISQILSF